MIPTQDPSSKQDDWQANGAMKKPTTLVTDAAPRPFPEICADLRRRVTALLEEQTDDEVLQSVQKQVRISTGVIKEALERFRPEQLSLSYNGGKDCLVLLILIMACWPASTVAPADCGPNAAVSSVSKSTSSEPAALQAIYIASPQEFPEVRDFVAVSARQYHLDLVRYNLPMRSALEAYLAERPAVKAIFMGTRRTDPHGELLTHFNPTDKDWPQFLRVNALIDWHYAEVWAFIRHLDIPYCCLYDRGFTSLGGVTDTHPNPALALNGSATFRPAYELVNDDEERLGRDR